MPRAESPTLVFADLRGQVLDAPSFASASRSGCRIARTDPADLMPLPRGSELYFLPQRNPVGFADTDDQPQPLTGCTAVAAFLPPGYAVFALAAFQRQPQ